MVQTLGILGAAIILASMMIPSTHRRQNIIMRSINIVGSIIMVIYSLQLFAYSTAVLNIIGSVVNIYYICKLLISMKKDGKKFFKTKTNNIEVK